MITEKDLQEAIAECLGERKPSAQTCIKLAAFYTVMDTLYPKRDEAEPLGLPSYSYSQAVGKPIEYQSDTDFGKAIDGRDSDEIWPLIDELVSVVQLVTPRIYDSFMQKLR